MVKKITHFVDFMCKTRSKTLCKVVVKNCANLTIHNNLCKKTLSPQVFIDLITTFFTTNHYLLLINNIHISTDPTITTTNNILISKERI